MAKYKKKPVVIEAVQWKGEEILFNVPKWLSDEQDKGVIKFISDKQFTVKTLEGNMVGNVGDFIIQGVQGEIYPCKSDIFYKTYEKVGD